MHTHVCTHTYSHTHTGVLPKNVVLARDKFIVGTIKL